MEYLFISLRLAKLQYLQSIFLHCFTSFPFYVSALAVFSEHCGCLEGTSGCIFWIFIQGFL